jgi:hypothetical protein
MMAGLDDNVQMNGSGADSFGQAVPGIKLDIFGDHQLHVDVDCQAGLARLAHPQEFGLSSGAFATNESCALGTKLHFSQHDRLLIRSSATYAQDPFAIAGQGLLLKPGQTQVFVGKFGGEWDHALSARSDVVTSLDFHALAFGMNDPGNGYVLTPGLRYVRKTSLRSKWDFGVREQLFFGVGKGATNGGLLSEAHAGLVGWTYALTPYADLTARAGPMLLTSPEGAVLFPSLRFSIESYTPSTAISLTMAHDLMIGPTGAGPVVGDIAELGLIKQWLQLGAHARLGLYRNNSALHPVGGLGAIGYGAEVGVEWAFTRNLKLGIAALRDARLNDVTIEHQVDRDVVQLRLTWEKARFN